MRKSKSSHSATLIDALKFVGLSGAEYCSIGQGFVTAYTDTVCMGHPITEDLNAKAHIKSLQQSLIKSEHETTITQLDLSRLQVNSGELQIFINCSEKVEQPKPDFDGIKISKEFLLGLHELLPIVLKADSNISAKTIMTFGESIFATNRFILVERWHGANLPFTNMSRKLCDLIIKCKKEVAEFCKSDNSVTIYFSDRCWIMGRISPELWINPFEILNKELVQSNINDELQESLRLVPGFNGSSLAYQVNGRLQSEPAQGAGASYPCGQLPDGGIYGVKELKYLQKYGKQISIIGDDIYFFGDKMRGAISSRKG